jgi:hypothetical protein
MRRTRAGLLLAGTPKPRRALLCLFVGCAVVVMLAAFASNAPSSAAATSEPSAAILDAINTRYRLPMGLPAIAWDDLNAQAAANHVNYWNLNGTGAGFEMHDETPGKPGFTGVSSQDRCRAVGSRAACSEIAYPDTALAKAVPLWLNTPFHGLPLLTGKTLGCADDRSGSACEITGFTFFSPLGSAATINQPDSHIHVWPFDGATDMVTSWTGGEVPDPLAVYQGDRNDIGPAFFIATASPAQVTLDGPKGPIALLGAGATVTETPYQAPAGPWMSFFPARALQRATHYKLTISDATGSYPVTFTTIVPTWLRTPAISSPRMTLANARAKGVLTYAINDESLDVEIIVRPLFKLPRGYHGYYGTNFGTAGSAPVLLHDLFSSPAAVTGSRSPRPGCQQSGCSSRSSGSSHCGG